MGSQESQPQPHDERVGWRRRLILLLFLIGIGGVLIRMKGGEEAQKITPFVTECALAMLIGIGLGVATRSVAKLLVFIAAASFVILQVLAYREVLEVNWPQIGKFVQNSVLNVDVTNTSLGSIVQHKLPSAGALLIGYFFGLKRG